MSVWNQSRWSSVRIFRTVCFEHIKYVWRADDCGICRERHKERACHLRVTSTFCMTVKSPPFLSPSPPLFKMHFLLSHAIPAPSPSRGSVSENLLFPSTLRVRAPTSPLPFFFCDVESCVNIPSLAPSLPSSCEIAVVSYGFLFLRDGRWAHVGVEATKHAARARRAGQFPVDMTAAMHTSASCLLRVKIARESMVTTAKRPSPSIHTSVSAHYTWLLRGKWNRI